jgi:tetratricopeptide (TPR) repeat protein/predicted Ser/Thr protein kinase
VPVDTDADPIEAALAQARPTEEAELALAQARIAGQLFGPAAAGFGRFRVLERLGRGGMGVVYAAYDPELDRGVALKTIHVPRGAQELAVREAKALARLSHPNVVPVFDVGVAAGHVYIVMELVRGAALREWVKDKPLRAILDAYRQAAAALAAAHAAGLVHRDFKPDNAIVGVDGRVRVVDFGLACEVDERPASRSGTPKYMAPESTISPAADQFSFGASLAEAVPAPRPRWLEDIVARATAAAPGARFASMQDLLRALGRDPALVRRRRIIAAAVFAALAVASAGAFFVGTKSARVETCAGATRELAATWDHPARRTQLARLAALSAYGAEISALLARQLERHERRWIANHRDACLAHQRGEQSAVLLDRRMACLDRSRAGLAALADVVTTADASQLPDLARAAHAVPDPDACNDLQALADDVEPPPRAIGELVAAQRRSLERARVQLGAGKLADARSLAATVTAAARALAYGPLLAEALLVHGRTLMAVDAREPAITTLDEATKLALASRLDAIAIEAWARRAWLEGTGGAPAHAIEGLPVVDALASRLTSPFPRALLHNNLGGIYLAGDRRDDARTAFERALQDARAVTGPGAIELVAVRTNMAIVIDDPAAQAALFDEAIADLTRLLGADHPDTLHVAFMRATIATTELPRVADQLAAVCAQTELHAALAGRAADCWLELADVRAELDDVGGAAQAAQRSVTLDATDEAAAYARLWQGDARSAEALFRAALKKRPRRDNEPWYQSYARARLELGLARTRPRDMRALLDSAVAALTPIARNHSAQAIQRRLARARVELAQLTDSPSTRDRATSTP